MIYFEYLPNLSHFREIIGSSNSYECDIAAVPKSTSTTIGGTYRMVVAWKRSTLTMEVLKELYYYDDEGEPKDVMNHTKFYKFSYDSKTINIIPVHLWPNRFQPKWREEMADAWTAQGDDPLTFAEHQAADKDANNGRRWKDLEITKIMTELSKLTDAPDKCFIMGDFNSLSREDYDLYTSTYYIENMAPRDNSGTPISVTYAGCNDPDFIVRGKSAGYYIKSSYTNDEFPESCFNYPKNTNFKDIIYETFENRGGTDQWFLTTSINAKRLDLAYASNSGFAAVSDAFVAMDNWVNPGRPAKALGTDNNQHTIYSLYKPSDHRPVIIDLNL